MTASKSATSGIIILTISVSILFILSGCGEPNESAGLNEYDILGAIHTLGFPQDITSLGDTLFVAENYHGLGIYNIANPSSPLEISRIIDNTIVGWRAHLVDVAAGFNAILLNNYANSTSFEITSLYKLDDFTSFGNNIIYPPGNKRKMISRFKQGITMQLVWQSLLTERDIIEVVFADPTLDDGIQKWIIYYDSLEVEQNVIGYVSIRNTHSQIFLHGQTATCVDFIGEADTIAAGFGELGIVIYDITGTITNSVATQLGSVDTQGEVKGVDVAGNYIYAADGIQGLTIIDIHDVNNPTVAGNWKIRGLDHAFDVVVQDHYLALLDEYDGVFFMDVSSPAAPVFVSQFEVRGVKAACFLASDTGNQKIAVASEEFGVSILGLLY